jgi:hypothetical protein
MIRIALGCAALLIASTAAYAAPKTLTCSGEVWNVWSDGKELWLEVGHGLYQCSFRVPAAKVVLSVCELRIECIIVVRPDRPRRDGGNVEISTASQILAVTRGDESRKDRKCE